ncbi:MAG TPA: helicase C-terminal domain-containing protein [Gemmatimonadaceae bacterium]|nr:helicase C-terminal domain-containing protein [Gemmatimonadaceae bacterium]
MPAADASARIAPNAAAAVRAAIRLAGGREVCFVCKVDEREVIVGARVVARGDIKSVLALPGFAQRGELLLHNHPSGNLEPSGPDLEIAARMHDAGVGFAIVDNEASEVYVVVEVPRERRQAPVDVRGVDALLGAAGPIARLHQRYEDRASQRGFARTIARLYNGGGIGVLEAGTGVGKSLGYLVPALRWAAQNGERTVVSTNTINLQEQLVGKDLPFLARALEDQPVRFALLKGWHNYVCLLRLEQARGAGATLFDPGSVADMEAIAAWAERTGDGSLSDLVTPPKPDVWDEVAAEPDLCLRLQCPHFDRCFLFAARRQAAQADVIVVNHHLLLADLAVRRASQKWDDSAVLPPYSRLVIDEGHHLEDAAASHLGATATRRGLQRLFGRLERRGKGLLPTLAARLSTRKDLLSVASLDLVHARLFPSAVAAREKGGVVFDLLDGLMQEARVPVLRLTETFADHPIWRAGLAAALEDLLRELALLGDNLRLVRERLETDEQALEAQAALLGELRGVSRRLDNAGDALREGLTPAGKHPTVRWLEVRGKERNLAVTSVPLDLAPILREDLFKRLETAIVTSATLSTDGKFDFVRARLGLTEDDVEPDTQVFPSPFDYPSQAMLAVPTDIPAPNVDPRGHFEAVVDAIAEVARAAGGGVFALFTSHRDVREAAQVLRERGVDQRFPLMVHGEDGRAALLRRFTDAGHAILLGTSSFWEGVDVPGDPLRALVLSKLPFKVPTEPLTAAHCEAIASRGGDPFREYMIPHAALRLKQGFGRLIRTATDQGVVVLMDPRAESKPFGRELVEGLPPARRVIAPWSEVAREITRFYARPGKPKLG